MYTNWLKKIATILACFMLALPAAAQGLKAATNLAADARLAQSRQVVVLVLFMSHNCHYCERVLNEFLVPMQRNRRDYEGKVIMRQVDIHSDAKMIDFAGRTTTQQRFALANKVQLTPTVHFFLPSGEAGAAPIVGLLTPDYYGGYLDAAIDEARQKIVAHP